MTAPDEYLDAGGPPDRDRDALFDEMRVMLVTLTGALNAARLIMTDDKTRDMAGEMVNNARAILARVKMATGNDK